MFSTVQEPIFSSDSLQTVRHAHIVQFLGAGTLADGSPFIVTEFMDRGCLAAGCMADIVVFDPTTIGDPATYGKPMQYATGVNQVFVNGVQVLRDGEHTGATPGRVVRGPGWVPTASR